jgi:hypothetical protein
MAAIRFGMLATAIVSTSLVIAPSGHADSASDFITRISEIGLNPGNSVDGVITISAGEQICQLLHYGQTPQVAARQVHYLFPSATPQQSASFVEAAQATLCEHAYTPLQTGGDY